MRHSTSLEEKTEGRLSWLANPGPAHVLFWESPVLSMFLGQFPLHEAKSLMKPVFSVTALDGTALLQWFRCGLSPKVYMLKAPSPVWQF
jgi:hypothetical protein